MKKRFIWLLCEFVVFLTNPAYAEDIVKSCIETFKQPPFVSLDLATEHDMGKLTAVLSELLGQNCTLNQLQDYLISKHAQLDSVTNKNIYLLVTMSTKFIRTGELRLATSIIAEIENNKIVFIDANVSK